MAPAMPMQPVSREKRGPPYFKKEMQRREKKILSRGPHKRGLQLDIKIIFKTYLKNIKSELKIF